MRSFFIAQVADGFAQQYKRLFNLVRILPRPPTWIGARPGHANPKSFDDPARLEKRLDFRCATRNTGAAIRHAPSQHGCYRIPKQLARNAKNP
jgi:hypothetical protein